MEGQMESRRTAGAATCRLLPALLSIVTLPGCAGSLTSNPAVFTWQKEPVKAARAQLDLTLVKPASPTAPRVLVLFGSGDGGLMGVSKALVQHLADGGYYVAGFSSREALNALRNSAGRLDYVETRDTLAAVIAEAKRRLELPEDARVVVTGMSRGANMVIVAAGDRTLRPVIVGAVAVALTRELDYLAVPEGAERLPGVEMDQKGRVRTYPAIERLGSIPLAIIQSTNDKYVPAAQSRRLLGPDTPTRRLYEVQARDHSFGGGEAALMRDLDDAMKWVTAANRSQK
jgi:dienelactone hydrolase